MLAPSSSFYYTFPCIDQSFHPLFFKSRIKKIFTVISPIHFHTFCKKISHKGEKHINVLLLSLIFLLPSISQCTPNLIYSLQSNPLITAVTAATSTQQPIGPPALLVHVSEHWLYPQLSFPSLKKILRNKLLPISKLLTS
jgi:hypothetical protein